MTWHQWREPVFFEGIADRPAGLRVSDLSGDPTVGPHLTAGNRHDRLPDLFFKQGPFLTINETTDSSLFAFSHYHFDLFRMIKFSV
jgi:hypothetical protein